MEISILQRFHGAILIQTFVCRKLFYNKLDFSLFVWQTFQSKIEVTFIDIGYYWTGLLLVLLSVNVQDNIWANSWQNQQNGMSAQGRLRLASTQSEESLRCPHEETLGPQLPIEYTVKTDQTGRMLRLIWVFARRTGHFVGFVVMGLNICMYLKLLFKICILYRNILNNFASLRFC